MFAENIGHIRQIEENIGKHRASKTNIGHYRENIACRPETDSSSSQRPQRPEIDWRIESDPGVELCILLMSHTALSGPLYWVN